MKSLTTIGILALATGAAMAQTNPAKDAMHRIYSDIETAYNKADAAMIVSYFSPDFKWKMMDDKVLNYHDAKNEIKSELAAVQNGKWHIQILDFIGSGPVGMTVVQYDFKGRMVDESKQSYSAELISTERQYWTKTNGKWLQTRDEMVNVKFRGNGLNPIANILTSDKPTAPGSHAPSGNGN